jgi:hypothetical protein
MLAMALFNRQTALLGYGKVRRPAIDQGRLVGRSADTST